MLIRLIKRRKLRTTFAILGVAIGIGSVVALHSVTEGTINQYQRIAAEYRGDVMVQRAGMPDPALSLIDSKYVDELQALPEVAEAYPVVFYAIKLLQTANGTKPSSRFFVMTGVPAGSDLLRRHKLTSGRYFTDNSNEILLGATASTDLGLKEGDNLKIDQTTLKVVGRYKTGIRVMDKGAILSISDIQTLKKNRNINIVVLDLKQRAAEVRQVIAKISAAHPDLEPLRSSDVLSSFDQVKILRNVSYGVSVIAIFVAIIGILNTMIMSVYERTREIGVLRAIGWSPKMILAMIFKEGILISLLGGVVGLLLGVIGTELLVRTIDIGLIDAFYPAYIPIIGLTTALLVGLIGSAIPALKAIRITPLEALRHE